MYVRVSLSLGSHSGACECACPPSSPAGRAQAWRSPAFSVAAGNPAGAPVRACGGPLHGASVLWDRRGDGNTQLYYLL